MVEQCGGSDVVERKGGYSDGGRDGIEMVK